MNTNSTSGRPTRRAFLAAGGAALLAAHSTHSQTASKPNILYVFSDEHRYQSMSFTEMPELQTPAMARMAREGFSFTNCISNYPVCSPHRAILMTGRWPYQTGMIDNNIDLAETEMTLAKAFQAAGYDTAYIGKWHLGGTRAEPFGFDLSLIWTGTNTHYDQAQYHPSQGDPVRPKGYNATNMTDQAIAYLERERTKPFFLMLSLNPPHADFLDAPPEKKALYPDGRLPHRPNFQQSDAKGASGAFRVGSPHYEGYHAHISAIDDELARIMDTLDRLGLTENTLLFYSSDHGSMQGSHGVGSKRQPYEESIRVPFLVRAPGHIAPGSRSDALFSSIDIMPTLCGLAGLPVPSSCQGQDFSSWITGGRGPDPESQLIMHIQKLNASGGNAHPAPLFRGLRTKTHTYAVGPEGLRLLSRMAPIPIRGTIWLETQTTPRSKTVCATPCAPCSRPRKTPLCSRKCDMEHEGPRALGNALALARRFMAEVLPPGAWAVDATAGNGYDTLFLAECVGAEGRVFAFDVQEEALAAAHRRVSEAGHTGCVAFFAAGHEHMLDTLPKEAPGRIGGIMFNLGYLPGGDKAQVTQAPATVAGLEQACEALASGGRVTVVLYTGHVGGKTEAEAVRAWAATLDQKAYHAATLEFINQQGHPPSLLIVEKR